MQIKGTVLDEPIPLDGCSAYVVMEDKCLYLVFAAGGQSTKDCLFLNKGQEIEICGKCISNIEGVVLPDKAKINLNKK